MNMAKSKSSFAGFLDGYKAGNISSIAPRIEIQTEEIKAYLNLLIDNITDNKDLVNSLGILKNTLIDPKNDILTQLLLFSEVLSNNIVLYKNIWDDPTNMSLLKKIIYILINIAEEIDDPKLTSLAIKIGNSFL